MKKFIVMVVACFCYLGLMGQNFVKYSEIKLEEKTDYAKVEKKVVECCDYILSKPLEDNNLNFMYATQFLIRWMGGTPNYTFDVDENAVNLSKKNEFLLSVYFAAMTKYVLKNKEGAKDIKKVKLEAMKMLLDYCENPDNKVKKNKDMKKMLEAKKNGQLEEYLKI